MKSNILIPITVLLILLFITFLIKKEQGEEYSNCLNLAYNHRVVAVGVGCTEDGTCPVMLDNGLKWMMHQPVVGQVNKCEYGDTKQ